MHVINSLANIHDQHHKSTSGVATHAERAAEALAKVEIRAPGPKSYLHHADFESFMSLHQDKCPQAYKRLVSIDITDSGGIPVRRCD